MLSLSHVVALAERATSAMGSEGQGVALADGLGEAGA